MNQLDQKPLPPYCREAGTGRAAAPLPNVFPLRDEQEIIRALAPWQRALRRQKLVKPGLLLCDLLVMWLCFLAGRVPAWLRHDMSFVQAMNVWWVDHGQLRMTLFLALSMVAVVWLGAVKGHYTAARRKPWWDETRDMFFVVGMVAMIDVLVLYLGKWQLSRLWTGVSWTLILLLLPLARRALLHRLLRAGLLAQPYVMVGRPEDVALAAGALASEPLMGCTPVAVVCPESSAARLELGGQSLLPIPLSSSVRQFLATPGPYQVVAVMGEEHNHWLSNLAQEIMLTRDDVIIIPALSGLPLLGMEVSHFFSHEVLLLRARNNLHRRTPQLFKRLIDIVGASVLLVLLSPLLAWVAWQIRREDGGPVFFVQPRIGKNGQPFPFIKFRSMVLDADVALEQWKASRPSLWAEYRANNFKLVDDPRVTRVGRWIRRTSVDELPQLVNVLKGSMSLVGPRPLLARELPDYGPAIAIYGQASPGITGLWQINGRSNSTFKHRIAMDLWYVRNWSLWYDLVILLRTVRVVLRQDGAV